MLENLNFTLKPDRNFFKIFLNDVFLGRLHKNQVFSLNLNKIEIPTYEQISKLKQILKKQCFNKAIQLLTRRDYSKLELIQKLKKTHNVEIINYTVKKLQNLNYINDLKYATNLAKKLITEKYLGKNRAIFEMKLKGIDTETAEQTVTNLNIDITEVILKIIKKKFKNKLINYENRQRIIKYLISKGHYYNDIINALSIIENI